MGPPPAGQARVEQDWHVAVGGPPTASPATVSVNVQWQAAMTAAEAAVTTETEVKRRHDAGGIAQQRREGQHPHTVPDADPDESARLRAQDPVRRF